VLQDAQGKTLFEREAEGGTATFEGLEPGKYTLVASAPRYYTETIKLTIEKPGAREDAVTLSPKPGKVTVVNTATSRVSVLLEAGEFHQERLLPEAGSSESWKDLPAGPVSVRASRPGFRSAGPLEAELEPEGEVTIEVPALEELRGTLVVRSSVGGVRVRVVDSEGEEILEREVGPGETELGGVRAGRHQLRAERPGYRDFERDVEVRPEESTPVDLELALEKTNVVFTGPPELRFNLLRAEGNSTELVDVRTVSPAGRVSLPLPPGHYLVKYAGGDEVAFEVKVGEDTKEVPLPVK